MRICPFSRPAGVLAALLGFPSAAPAGAQTGQSPTVTLPAVVGVDEGRAARGRSR
ncbi:MAG: hypothetical protein IT180_08405 [Acidobacteria bacterium]|nr:hypothetical protein [Acidobacteriota bacterium]